MLTEFKFCSGNLGSWNCYVLWNLPKSYFQQNQRYPFVPNVICRSMDKKLWSAEYSSCLSNPSLSLQNKPRWQQTNEQSHSSRCTHELSVLQVPCWGRRLDVAHHFFSFFLRMFLFATWLCCNVFGSDLPLSFFHRIWYQFLIFIAFDTFTASEIPCGQKDSFPTLDSMLSHQGDL